MHTVTREMYFSGRPPRVADAREPFSMMVFSLLAVLRGYCLAASTITDAQRGAEVDWSRCEAGNGGKTCESCTATRRVKKRRLKKKIADGEREIGGLALVVVVILPT